MTTNRILKYLSRPKAEPLKERLDKLWELIEIKNTDDKTRHDWRSCWEGIEALMIQSKGNSRLMHRAGKLIDLLAKDVAGE